MTEKTPPTKRDYPAVYEKIVPIALSLLAAIVVAILIYTILVGIGVLNFG